MAITIYTTSSYNVNIKLGRARGQDQKPAFLNPIVPALKRASNSFPFGMRGGLSSDHTWALHPVNHAIYTQPPKLLQSQERFARGVNTSLSVRKHPYLSKLPNSSSPPV